MTQRSMVTEEETAVAFLTHAPNSTFGQADDLSIGTACVHPHLQHASDAELDSHLQFVLERHTIRGIF